MRTRQPVSFRLPPDAVEQLGDLAKHFGINRTAIIKELIARTHRAFVPDHNNVMVLDTSHAVIRSVDANATAPRGILNEGVSTTNYAKAKYNGAETGTQVTLPLQYMRSDAPGQ